MKLLVLAVMSLSLSGGAFGQRRGGQYWSLGGYGNVLFPGTGHAPATPPGGATGPYFSHWAVPSRTRASPQQDPVVSVPSAVYGGGYAEDTSGNDPAENPVQIPSTNPSPVPPVIINQNLVPSHDLHPRDEAQACANLPGNLTRAQAGEEDRPTIYLIALKDHSIVQALGYWMEAATLHYVSAEYAVNQVSIVLIDRDLSERLNSERGLAFKLPAAK